jgi:hypothetical protein
MKTAASLVAAALAFAVVAGSAAAKEIKSAKVCGASECVTVTDREKANSLLASDAPGSPPPAAGFYTVEVTVDAEGEVATWTFYYVPSARMARAAYEPGGEAGPSVHAWGNVSPEAAAIFREIVRGLEPFPKPHLSSAVIGSKTVVGGADSYLRLFELPHTTAGGLPVAYSEWIDLRSTHPTPWTDTSRDLSFSPSTGLLERGGQVVQVPDELLADMRAGRPLTVGDDAALAWRRLVATLAIALAAAVAIAFLFRRLGAPRAQRSRRAARARD